MKTSFASSILFVVLAAGCATPQAKQKCPEKVVTEPAKAAAPTPTTHEDLNAVLWVRTSAEYGAVAESEYQAAHTKLDAALKHKDWSAATEQTKDFKKKPPAIIVDVDETVLDNSPYEARLVKAGTYFSHDTWDAWCQEQAAKPIPGALEFLKYAAKKGVTIFYVTNRDHKNEEATRGNLEKDGFPMKKGEDVILTKNEKPDWTSDKTTRRQTVAAKYRIVMMFGDNLGDFIADKGTPSERVSIAQAQADKWGKQWFMIPNPMYGHWESAAFGGNYKLSHEEQAQKKVDALGAK